MKNSKQHLNINKEPKPKLGTKIIYLKTNISTVSRNNTINGGWWNDGWWKQANVAT